LRHGVHLSSAIQSTRCTTNKANKYPKQMGNQVGSVSSAEVNNKYNQCLQDLTEYELQTKLKETAFFKVVRSRHSEGDVVLKVYIPPNSSVPIKEYLDRIDAQKRVFPNPTNANVLPYQRCHYSERYACLVRQFVKYSLYDRMDTRPFLLDVEKRWIAFQLLCAIATLNKVSLCHGDIKSENVLLTSWGWVLLTDFAPFKPVFLPDDNPADYSFYFDISGRRTCYIAPERFYHANRSSAYGKAAAASASGVASTAAVEPDADFGLSQKQQNVKRGQLEHSMDVFSAGCVLLELFSEDSNSQPFDLSQLLAFKKDQYTPAKLILRLADENIRDLITTMLSKEPLSRLSGEELLIQQRGKAFPDYFYTFLKTYLAPFASEIQLPDDKIARLKKALFTQSHIAKFLILDSDKKSERNVGLVIILNLLTSSVRHVRFAQSKLDGLKCLEKLACHLPDHIVLDRILPYILDMMTDSSSRVRSGAILSLANTVGRIDTVGYKYVNLFADYIFPTVEHLSRDVSVQVRSSLAEILGRLADTAKKFLDSVREQSMAAWLPPMEGQNATITALSQQEAQHLRAINFEAELQSLRRTVSGLTVTLLHDSCPAVKQSVLCSDALRLCTFFGRREASDHVMSHAITFLNEGPDLRWSFYEQLYCMVAFIGDHGAEMLVPLLEQGLADPDPAVLVAALICLRSLVADRSSDVGRRFGAPLCAKSLPLLSHPDVFVRHAAAGLLCATAGRLGPAEFHCRLVAPDSPNSPRVSNHLPAAAKRLAGSQRHLANEVLVLSALGPPVPPAAWRCLATTPRHLVERLFVALEERRHVRLRCQTAGAGNIQDSAGGSGDESGAAADGPQQPCYARLEEDAAALLAKLGHLGLEESMEDRLLALRDLALKQTTASSAAALSTPSVSSAAVDYIGVERLKLSDLATVTEQQSVLPRHLSLSATGVTVSASNVVAASVLAGQPAASSLASMGAAAPAASLGATAASDFASGSSVAVAGSSPSAGGGAPAGSVSIATTAAAGVVLPPASGRCATCRTDLDNLLARRRAEYGLLNSIVSSVSYSNSSAGGSLASAAFPGCDTWTPKGVLVNHISEHRGRINSLSVSADHRAFATASDDATVRLWDLSDCHKNPDQCVSGKSKLTYADFPSRVLGAYWQAGPDYSVVACTEAGAYQLCASTGQLRWRWSAARPTRYDAEQLGAITCLSPVPDSANCFLVATARGALLTWDVRTQDFVARYDVDPSVGLITAVEAHSLTSWLAAGTSRGIVDVWDCRFQLPLVQLRHPTSMRVLRLRVLPWSAGGPASQLLLHPHRLLVSVQSNNEVGDWDLRSCERVRCVWASVAPVLSVTQSTPRGCHAVLPVGPDRWYAGSDDCRLRLWDWARPADSRIVAGKFSDSVNRRVAYRREAREALTANSNTDVLFEAYLSANAGAASGGTSSSAAANVAATSGASLVASSAPPAGSLLSAQQRASTMGFRDAVTDIALMHAGQPYLLTATRDGVIKYWK
ncbi:hypothetical protein BOX15_Mlig011508g5, partial [Macrostomum lignano]